MARRAEQRALDDRALALGLRQGRWRDESSERGFVLDETGASRPSSDHPQASAGNAAAAAAAAAAERSAAIAAVVAANEEMCRDPGGRPDSPAPPAPWPSSISAPAACLAGAGVALTALAVGIAASSSSGAPATGSTSAAAGTTQHEAPARGPDGSPALALLPRPRPFRCRAPMCMCNHGGTLCTRLARQGLDAHGRAWDRCSACCFRAVETVTADNIVCICGCHCSCAGCAAAGGGHQGADSQGASSSSSAAAAGATPAVEVLDGEPFAWNPADLTFYRVAIAALAPPAGVAAAGGLWCACTRVHTGGTGSTSGGTGCTAAAPQHATAGWRCAPCGGPWGDAAASACVCRCSGCCPA
jgi:hypothetical protein